MVKDRIRILIVEDFELVRMMLRNALNELGFFDIDEAEDGATALEMLRSALATEQPFALVFSDWNMPNMTGLELVKCCRSDPALSSLPIVMVSAESGQSSIILAMTEGATDYVMKPLVPDVLQRKINRILARTLGES